MKYKEIIETILGANDILIFTHTNMDGDAIGSAVALCLALKKLGKRAAILLEDEIPGYIQFVAKYAAGCFAYSAPFIPQLSVAIDISTRNRLENRRDIFFAAEKQICIDHHQKTEELCKLSVIEPEAAACAMLIMELLKEIEAVSGVTLLDKPIAEALYTGIVTDTGCFKYSNADKRCLLAAAELYECGIDHSAICNEVYDNYPLAQLRLEAAAINDAELFAAGLGVISVCTLAHLERYSASSDMTESAIDKLRSIKGVEIAAYIKERAENRYKISLRSKYSANVLNIAKAFGGGGHIKSAGATVECSLAELYTKLKEEMAKELSRCGIL